MMWPAAASSVVETPANLNLIQACPLDGHEECDLFVAIGEFCVSLWCSWPLCLISYYEWNGGIPTTSIPSSSEQESRVRYIEIVNCKARQLDVRRDTGIIDRFQIISCRESVLPVSTTTISKTDLYGSASLTDLPHPILATPKLALRYEGQFEVESNAISSPPSQRKSSITKTVSKLIKSKTGIVGQPTSEGCFLFEITVSRKGQIQRYDLRPFQLLLPQVVDEQTLEHLVVSRSGRLAVVTGPRLVQVYNLDENQGDARCLSRIQFEQEAREGDEGEEKENGIRQVRWLNDKFLAVLLGGRIAITSIMPEEKPVWLISLSYSLSSMDFVPSTFSLVATGVDKDSKRPVLLRFPFWRAAIQSHNISSPACFHRENQILWLKLSGATLPLTSLRDHPVAWEYIDVPIDHHPNQLDPIKKIIADENAAWLAVVWSTGFGFANLRERQWNFFSDPRDIQQRLFLSYGCWINVPGGEKADTCVFAATVAINSQLEFFLFDANTPLNLSRTLHRQVTESQIIGLYALGKGALGILQENFDLQVVQLEWRTTGLRMSLLMRVSLASVMMDQTGSETETGYKVEWHEEKTKSYCHQFALLIEQNLLILSCRLGLLAVGIPGKSEPIAQDGSHTTEIRAKVISSFKSNSFWVWQPTVKMVWIILAENKTLTFYNPVNFTSFVTQLDFQPQHFYPHSSGGLLLGVSSGFKSINGNYRMQVEESCSLPSLLLLDLLKKRDDTDDLTQMADLLEQATSNSWERVNVVEMTMARILQLEEIKEQEYLYSKLRNLLQSTPSIAKDYIRIVNGFLRKIEISDALRIMEVLGPFKVIFGKALASQDLVAAFGFLRIQSTKASLKEFLKEPYTSLLRTSYADRHLEVFRGVVSMWWEFDFDRLPITEIYYEVASRRDWPFLEPLGLMLQEHASNAHGSRFMAVSLEEAVAHALLYTDRHVEEITLDLQPYDSLSRVVSMLQKFHLEEEARVWSVIVDGILPKDLSEDKKSTILNLVSRYHDLQ